MSLTSYPVSTIFNQSGTYTSDQNTNDVPSGSVRKILFGVNVTALTGSTGVDVSVGGKSPDGNYYELGHISNIDGAATVNVSGPIPEVLNIGLGLRGASSATVSYWIIGQD